MKKYLLLSLSLFAVSFINAQFTAGQKMIGGQFAFGTSNTDVNSPTPNSNKSFEVGISPSFSRFSSPTVFSTIGFSYVYTHSSFSSGTDEQVSFSHGLGIYAERTKLEQLAKRFYFTYSGRIGFLYNYGKAEYTTPPGNNSENKTYGGYAGLGIGLLYQVNQRFLLSCNLNNLLNIYYNYTENKLSTSTDLQSKSNSAGITTGLSNISLNSISIGVKYLLKK